MQVLNLDLLKYSQELRLSDRDDQRMVFDPVRKGSYLLTKEEFVRQLFIHYLIDQKGVSPGRIAVERKINTVKLDKRFDLLVFDRQAQAQMIVECKAADVPIDQKVLDQAGIYNEVLRAEFLVVTNGISTYIFRIDHETKKVQGLSQFPEL
jgi:hypothetical protein